MCADATDTSRRQVERLALLLNNVPRVTAIELSLVRHAPKLQRRAEFDAEARQLLDAARAWYDADHLPFWDAVFVLGEALPEGLPQAIVESALFHQDVAEFTSIELATGGQLADDLAEAIVTYGMDFHVSLLSRVTMDDHSKAHLPMLDFSTKTLRTGAQATVTRVATALGVSGALFESGRSYHFLAASAIPKPAFDNYLARALLFAPITDGRWIAHQLRSGTAALRISRGPYAEPPRFVASIVGEVDHP